MAPQNYRTFTANQQAHEAGKGKARSLPQSISSASLNVKPPTQ